MKKPKKLIHLVKSLTGIIHEKGEDGFACQIPRLNLKLNYSLCIIVSWGLDWDHISIHCMSNGKQFTPFWEDMCYVKELFFKPGECAVQYHPPRSDYINEHPYTLHLWRSQVNEILMPPKDFV